MRKNKIISVVAPIAMFLIIFSIWEIIVRALQAPKWLVPAPTDIFTSMVANFSELWPHIWVTLQTVIIGFVIAVPVGLLLSALITNFKLLSNALTPYITFLVTTPVMTLVPLLMLWIGYGIEMRIVTVVIQSFAVVNLNCCTGFLNVPVIRLELVKSLDASAGQSFFKVKLPSAARDVFTGIRLASIFATTACISAEYVGGNMGLGSQIIKYSQFLKTTESFACIFYITIIGVALYSIISFAEAKVVRWKT